MSRYVLQNLHRQKQAIFLLSHLLDEEFQHLGKGDPQSVATVEFSIQELLRQIAVERQELKRHVMDLDPSLPAIRDLPLLMEESCRDEGRDLLREIDHQEQICGRKAAQNAVTAQGLMDQNQALLDYLASQIIPKDAHTYSRHGKWHHSEGTGTLLHGRL
ncbi:FlgN protein [Desulfonatronum thiosulfatophilum]|uniref:FlgN protein n=1 Tax=Desulfonatronum thiosulfatophilum TaxID=617002 RepID=A0A1G6DIA3_9BACT|nr:flagellar protein FlgN [Desulfonatronum thiosulfatophilum]SDB44904.1 FlgN protein [Desulfonatronum thiosulfatophilum]